MSIVSEILEIDSDLLRKWLCNQKIETVNEEIVKLITASEQFCIDYVNGKLQQQFNLHVFKLEQEKYVKEVIGWTFIDFYDNQLCIDLIEAKIDILDLLDEVSGMPQGDDKSAFLKLYQQCAAYYHYVAPKRLGVSFVVKHFADEVDYTYTVDGFLLKNRDAVNQELVTVVRHSNVRRFCFIWKIFIFLIMQCQ